MKPSQKAFTIVELLVVMATLALLACVAVPGLSRTNPVSKTSQCMNNLRQLTVGFRAWSVENNEVLLSCADSGFISEGVLRTNWMRGTLDFSSGNRSSWDTNQDIVRSPLYNLVGNSSTPFRCPADESSILIAGVRWPRVRSYSLSDVFGRGAWLDRTYNTSQTVWRTYTRYSEIVKPGQTFCLMDEHMDSINDGSFANACTGAQPGDPPSSAQIIDIPASRHMNAANLSFSDGHAETHRWIGTKIRPPEVFSGVIPLNILAGDSWMDIQWLAANTTVKR